MCRQELVSMIPVKLLDAQPHHLVLDSCASPGSKTSQILEVMLDKHASGAVVANDASLQRANLLTHRCYRLEAAAKNLLVINHDAQTLPLELENTFDRILCDVPCSGDGTLRKSTDLWKKWSNSSGGRSRNTWANRFETLRAALRTTLVRCVAVIWLGRSLTPSGNNV